MRIGVDFDGTLLNSSLRHQVVLWCAINIVFKGNHRYCFQDFAGYVKYKSNGFSTFEYLQKHNIAEAETINEVWIKLIEENNFLLLDYLYDDALSFLNKKKNQTLFLVTARNNINGLLAQVKTFNLEPYFNDVLVINDGNNKSEATSKLNLDLIIGDTEVDFNWAQTLNIPYKILNRGFRSKWFWEQRGITSFQSLSEI